MVFSENMPGKEMFIIQKGSVKITKIVNDNEVLLAVLKQGDMFGEMSLIESRPRSASAIAFEDATLLSVNKENFAQLTRTLAERIWFAYKQLANTLLTNPVGRLYDALLIQLERVRIPIRPGEAYTFDFGIKELINMVGLPIAEGNQVVREMLKNPKIKPMDNRIHTTDMEDIEKQAKYYRKMERIEKARREQRRTG